MSNKLHSNYLSMVEDLAQTVGTIGPSAGLAIAIPIVFSTAGNGSWFLFLLMLAAYLLVGFNINLFASRIKSSGALSSYVEAGLGRGWGIVAGWSLLLGYFFVIPCIGPAFAIYIKLFTHLFLGSNYDFLISILSMSAVTLAAAWVAYKDIRLSTDLTLYFELFSVGSIVLLCLFYLFKSGYWIDPDQLRFKNTTWDGMRSGLVIAFVSLAGFESATTLSEESQEATLNIPRAIWSGLVPASLLYIMVCYVLVGAFHTGTPLDKLDAPFDALAHLAGAPLLGILIAIGILLCEFSISLACFNAGTRVLYSMSRQGEFHPIASRIHPTNLTPYMGIFLFLIPSLILPLFLFLRGTSLLDSVNYFSQMNCFGFLLSYVLVSIAAPFYMKQLGKLKKSYLFISIATVLLLLIPIVGSIFPLPDPPFCYLPLYFLVLLTAGCSYSFYLKRNKSLE